MAKKKWHVQLSFSDGETIDDGYDFDTEKEAKEYGLEMLSNYHEGGRILNMSNPGDYPLDDWDEPDIETWKA